ncbi:MAG TPA: cysteine dioxygenase family protein [Terriglobales bacterium]|nr:cysteine dioxygenase family protein [Terriglobales bacterium]
MDVATAQTVSIADFVQGLRRFPEAAFSELDAVRTFLQRNRVEPASLEPYLTWDRQHYTRNLIDKTPLYELIAICWEVDQHSSVHNHREQNCWMAVPIGRLLVQNYRVLFQDLAAGKCKLEPTDEFQLDPAHPCAVNPAEPVHKVYNPVQFAQRAVSLHVYSRPFDTCDVYSAEQGTCGSIRLWYTTEYGVPSRQPRNQ